VIVAIESICGEVSSTSAAESDSSFLRRTDNRWKIAMPIGGAVAAAAVVATLLLWPKAPLGSPVASQSHALQSGSSPTPAPSASPRKYKVYLNFQADGWQKPFGAVDQTLPGKVQVAMLAPFSSGVTSEAAFFNSTVPGSTAEMLFAAAADYSASPKPLAAQDVPKMLASLKDQTGLTVKTISLQEATSGMSVGCADATWGKASGAVCAWVDKWTIGFAMFFGKTTADVQGSFRSIVRQLISSTVVPLS
jgi:hypothetical protein